MSSLMFIPTAHRSPYSLALPTQQNTVGPLSYLGSDGPTVRCGIGVGARDHRRIESQRALPRSLLPNWRRASRWRCP